MLSTCCVYPAQNLTKWTEYMDNAFQHTGQLADQPNQLKGIQYSLSQGEGELGNPMTRKNSNENRKFSV